VVSDHGESFGEDGSMAHGSRLTASQIHVPCLIRSPRVRPGVRHDVAGSVDVFATLLDLAGVEADRQVGRSLVAAPEGLTNAFGMRRVYSPSQTMLRIDGNRYPVGERLFYAVLDGGEIRRGTADAMQAEPGAEPADKVEDQLMKLFATFASELEGRDREHALDDEDRRALEALGYVQ
jgi:arylsulfatase A-like enzyme